jgi:drug/metabolite transporter (DMT)-like permease
MREPIFQPPDFHIQMNVLELLALAAIWGASFLFMRVAVPELGPIALIALRVTIAALVLIPVLRSAISCDQLRSKAWPLFVVGVTNSAPPFCLLAYSTLYVNAGVDSILNATTPLWAALIAMVAFQGSMPLAQVAGLLFGLVGVVVLAWQTSIGGGSVLVLAIGTALLATLFYGFAVNYSKRHLAGVNPFVVAFGSQVSASIVLVPMSLFFWPRHAVASSTWACVAALGVVCTGFAYVLFFRLIERAGAAYAASVTFLIPTFGMIWGSVFLQEPITPVMISGCVIILFGTALASGKLGGLRTRCA